LFKKGNFVIHDRRITRIDIVKWAHFFMSTTPCENKKKSIKKNYKKIQHCWNRPKIKSNNCRESKMLSSNWRKMDLKRNIFV